jgi:N-acetylmuramoyl-L-alanine amidase
VAIYPAAIQQPLSSHGGLRTETLGICLHCETTEGNPWGYFSNPNNQASSTFWVSNLGQPYQYMDADLESWAQEAGNNAYPSVEFEGTIQTPYTASQMSAGAALIRWAATTYNFPIQTCDHGGTGVTTHCFYRPPFYPADPAWGGHTCPGPGPRLAQHAIMVNMAAGSITPPKERDQDMFVASTPKGDCYLVYTNGTVIYVDTADLAGALAAVDQQGPIQMTVEFVQTLAFTSYIGPGSVVMAKSNIT